MAFRHFQSIIKVIQSSHPFALKMLGVIFILIAILVVQLSYLQWLASETNPNHTPRDELQSNLEFNPQILDKLLSSWHQPQQKLSQINYQYKLSQQKLKQISEVLDFFNHPLHLIEIHSFEFKPSSNQAEIAIFHQSQRNEKSAQILENIVGEFKQTLPNMELKVLEANQGVSELGLYQLQAKLSINF